DRRQWCRIHGWLPTRGDRPPIFHGNSAIGLRFDVALDLVAEVAAARRTCGLLCLFSEPPLAPALDVDGRRRNWRRQQARPVEQNARVLRLNSPLELLVERRPPDLDPRR